jgi:hypothetical protein
MSKEKVSWRLQLRWWILRQQVWFGRSYYGYYGPRTVRIGPNTIVKFGTSVGLEELEAMRYVSENTTIPIPKVFAAWSIRKAVVIEMKFVDGISAWSQWSHLTQTERDALCNELVGYVEQLRRIIPPSQTQVSSVLGGPVRDHRLGVYPCGPFDNMDDFHTFLREGTELSAYKEYNPQVVELHETKFISKFTHGDLHPRNVIIDKHGKILSIIDWDCAGWRPEYWEYTKSQFVPFGIPQEWTEALKRATGDYEFHHKVERRLWVCNEFPSSGKQFLDTPVAEQ